MGRIEGARYRSLLHSSQATTSFPRSACVVVGQPPGWSSKYELYPTGPSSNRKLHAGIPVKLGLSASGHCRYIIACQLNLPLSGVFAVPVRTGRPSIVLICFRGCFSLVARQYMHICTRHRLQLGWPMIAAESKKRSCAGYVVRHTVLLAVLEV